MSKLLYTIAICAALIFGTVEPVTAQADKQTPENAHLFITQLSSRGLIRLKVPDYGYRVKHYSTNGLNGRYTINSWDSNYQLDPLIFNVAESASCKTSINAYTITDESYKQDASFYDSTTRVTIPGKEYFRPYVPHLQFLNSNGLNWVYVSKITDERNGAVLLQGSGFSGGYIRLYFDSPEMGARAAFAMEVIRQACDPVAATGF